MVWLGGMAVLPLLHNVDHRNDHTHTDSVHAHSHSATHEHPHDGASSSSGHERQPLDPEHGEGSLLHFAAAAVGETPALVPRLINSVVAGSSLRLPRVHPPNRLTVVARGPPAG